MSSAVAQLYHARPKKWSQVFTEAVEKNEEAARIEAQGELDLRRIAAAKLFIARKLCKIVREKIKESTFSCKRTLRNLSRPQPQLSWDSHLGSRSLCAYCYRPALCDMAHCRLCNCIAHKACLQRRREKESRRLDKVAGTDSELNRSMMSSSTAIQSINPLTIERLRAIEIFCAAESFEMDSDEAFECIDCLESMEADIEHHDETFDRLCRERVLKRTSKLVRLKAERGRLVHNAEVRKRGMVLMQSLLRKKIARRTFYSWRRTQMRVMVLEVDVDAEYCKRICAAHENEFSQMNTAAGVLLPALNVCVIVTIVDPIKHLQLFKYEKLASVCNREGELM